MLAGDPHALFNSARTCSVASSEGLQMSSVIRGRTEPPPCGRWCGHGIGSVNWVHRPESSLGALGLQPALNLWS